MQWVRRGLAVALFAIALYVGLRFPAENSGPVSVHYLFGRTGDHALWLVLLAAFTLGALLAGIPVFYLAAKGRLVSWRYRKALGGLEAEIHQLRNLPLAPDSPAPGDPAPAPPSAAPGKDVPGASP
jgi:uncharacterized integral membrane protein